MENFKSSIFIKHRNSNGKQLNQIQGKQSIEVENQPGEESKGTNMCTIKQRWE